MSGTREGWVIAGNLRSGHSIRSTSDSGILVGVHLLLWYLVSAPAGKQFEGSAGAQNVGFWG